MTGRA